MTCSVIFDFDGVLVDSVELKGIAFADTLQISDPEIRDAIMRHHLQNPHLGRFAKLQHYQEAFAQPKSTAVDKDMLNEFSERVVHAIIQRGLAIGARDFLEDHCDRWTFQISSAAPGSEISDILRKFGIGHLFLRVSGFPYKKAEFLSTQKNQFRHITFVGDSPSDWRAAQTAGVRFIGFRMPPGICGDFTNVATFYDLSAVLTRNENGD